MKYPLLLDEPGEKLDDEQRVAGGPGHLVGQVRTGRTAGEPPGQREHRLGVKRAQVKPVPPPWRAARPGLRPPACRSASQWPGSAPDTRLRRVSRRSIARLELSAQCNCRSIRTSSAVVQSDSNTPISASIMWWTSTGTSSRCPDQAPCPSIAGLVRPGPSRGPRRDSQRVANRTERSGLVEFACLRHPHGHPPGSGIADDLRISRVLPIPRLPAGSRRRRGRTRRPRASGGSPQAPGPGRPDPASRRWPLLPPVAASQHPCPAIPGRFAERFSRNHPDCRLFESNSAGGKNP